MRRIATVLFGLFMLGGAYAGGIPTAAPEDQTCTEGKSNVVIKTRYGLVSYGGEDYFKVDGKWVPTDRLHTADTITFKKLYRLGDEDVLLSAGIYTGNTDYPHFQDFLLVLGPGKAPQVILIPGDTACPMWQKANALYTGGRVDECGNKLPVARFELDEFILSTKAIARCVRKPYVVRDEDCREEFELSQKLCASVPREKCAQDANADVVGVYGPLSESGTISSMTHERYFNRTAFDEICLDRCNGRRTSYATYKTAMCMAR